MTKESHPNTPESEAAARVESAPPALPEDKPSDLSEMSRRDALATLAKYTAYTAPAVLAILSLTAKRAHAFSF